MIIKIKEVNPYEIEWDSRVKSIPEGTIYQTTYWARYLERYTKAKPLFLIAQGEKDDILGTLLLYRTHYFKRLLKFGILGNLIFEVINRLIPAATWNFGPLIYNKDKFDEIFISFLKEIERIAKNQGIFFLKDMSYPIHGDNIYTKSAPKIFSDRGFKPNERATILIDLTKPEDALWHGFKNSAKKAIRKSCNMDLEIGLMDKEQLKEYYNLLCESRRRVGVEMPPTYPNEAMWNGVGADSGRLKVFSVRMNGRLLAAIGIVSFNGIIFETGPAQSNYSFNNKIYVNDILKWKVIKWGSKNNNRIYDLVGIPLSIKNAREQKQRQFKEKWGGQIVRYQGYSKMLF